MIQLLSNPNIAEIYPLTPMQEGIYFHFLYDRNSPAFFVQLGYRIRGALDVTLVEKSLVLLHERHAILRTVFNHERTGKPLQVVLKKGNVDFQLIDFSDGTGKVPTEKLVSYKNSERLRMFDLNRDVLMRISLIKLDENHYEFVWSHHHILMDGWCSNILIGEFNSIYERLRKGKPISLPIVRPYSEYIQWLQQQDANSSIQFWKEMLEGYSGLASIPVFSRDKKGYLNKQLALPVDTTTTKALKKICEAYQITTSTIIQALWGILLSRFKGVNDVVFGVVVSGRPSSLPGVESMVGLFINTALTRVKFGNFPLSSLLLQLQRQLLATENHVYVSLADIQASTGLGSELLDHSMVFENFPDAGNDEGSVNSEPKSKSSDVTAVESTVFEQSNYNLDVRVGFGERQGIIVFRYNGYTYTDEQMLQVQEYLGDIIQEAVKNIHVSCTDLLKVTQKELALLRKFNDTDTPFPATQTPVSLIKDVVGRSPHKPAILFQSESITYQELWDKSNSIAHLLRRHLVDEKSIVGILMDRSPRMIEAILAVWKAGAAYLPLDPEYPFDRLRWICDNSEITSLIVDSGNIGYANNLQWNCDKLTMIYCADTQNIHGVRERENESMKRELWEFVAASSVDDITAGGWFNSYTGAPFTRQEMDEYVANTVSKLAPIINKDSRVLEIGCASGLTMFAIAPLVARYVGVDLSGEIIAKNREIIRRQGIENINLQQLFAHEIEYLLEKQFDLIIINSVVQNFHGVNYLNDVISKCIRLLKDEGHIFLGDLMDLSRKDDFLLSLRQYKIANPTNSSKTKVEWEDELFISPDFVKDLPYHHTFISSVAVTEKAGVIRNELTDFRFDALLVVNKLAEPRKFMPRKLQLDRRALVDDNGLDDIDHSDPRGLAYVIYTSGSTGEPKGAMVEHVGMVNHLYSKINTFEIDHKSRVLQNARHTFDISVWQFFSALVRGGTTHIFPQQVILSLPDFVRDLREHAITVAEVVPSYLDAMLDECVATSASFPDLKFLIATGETLPLELAERWLKVFPRIPLANAYGPTEASDDITHQMITSSPWTRTVPLGKTIQNMKIWVLDENMDLCAPGVKGEVCVNGVGVGRGYLRNEVKTAAAFVDHPLNKAFPEFRMYKTGDIGCWLPDGTLLFMGRKDYQVKIRGFRIELGDIESGLMKIEGVRNAVVVDLNDSDNQKYLAAYVVCYDRESCNKESLQRLLSQTLPEYMVPSQFMFLEELPLNSNGKIDRKKLPAFGGDDHLLDRLLPETDVERKLAEIWKQVLRVESVYANDNFFHLGGHSLKATRLASAIRKEMGVKVELRNIFESPVLSQLAKTVESLNVVAADDEIEPLSIQEKYEVSHAQKRMWILSQFRDASLAYNVFNAWYIKGDFDADVFQEAVRFLLERHEILRTTFVSENMEVFQIVHPVEKMIGLVTVIDKLPAKDIDQYIESLVQTEEQLAFDLESGPLLKFYLLTSPGYNFCMLKIHHIICDGWSMQLLFNELTTVYGALNDGQPVPLSPLKIQYKDFSAYQRRRVEDNSGSGLRNYWHNKLKAPLQTLRLPTIQQRPAQQTFTGTSHVHRFSKRTYEGLFTLANKHEASLFMMIVALADVLFYRYTGQDDIVFGTSVAGRQRKEIESQIGFYVNTLALRSRVSGRQRFDDLLLKTKQLVLEAFQHQEYPFDLLVDELSPARDLSRSALFDVLIELQNYQHAVSQQEQKQNGSTGSGSVLIQSYARPKTKSIFDLNLEFREEGADLFLTINYNTDVYTPDEAEAIGRHFENISSEVINNPTASIEDYYFLDEIESDRLKAFGRSTRMQLVDSPPTVYQLVSRVAANDPSAVAISFGDRSSTYQQLISSADEISALIYRYYDSGGPVCILMEPSILLVESILAVWKAGKMYVPLSPFDDVEMNLRVIREVGSGLLLTNSKHAIAASDLQWSCAELTAIACLDADNIYSIGEPQLESMNREMWEMVGRRATSDIEAGGWVDSYTGQPISRREMDEYSENAARKLGPFLNKQSKVLEIGCASGLTAFRIAPEVGEYIGTDMSQAIIDRNRLLVSERGIDNMRFECLLANEIVDVAGSDFDAVIINSVVQNFNGVNYLRDVLGKCLGKLKMGGIIFVGDVMDLAQRKLLIEDIRHYRQRHQLSQGPDFSDHKFYSRAFFSDLSANLEEVVDVEISNKIGSIENELTRFRFDVIIRKGLKSAGARPVYLQLDKRHLLNGNDHHKHIEDRSLAEQDAWISFSVGTEGRRKGAPVSHALLSEQLIHVSKRNGRGGPYTGLHTTSHLFHQAMEECFGPLLTGGRVVITEKQEPTALLMTVASKGINCVHVFPPTLSAMVATVEKGASVPDSLKQVVCSGDFLFSNTRKRFLNTFPGVNLFHTYGLAEVAGEIAISGPDSCAMRTSTPAGMQITVVNDSGVMNPIGVPGEIALVGVDVARSYIHEKNVPTHSTTFFTGDVGRWLPDGSLELFGKKRSILYVKNNRFFSYEVESQLMRCDGITNAVVRLHQDRNGDTSLAAFLQKDGDHPVDLNQVKTRLHRSVAGFMIPASYVITDELPVDVVGRIDRTKLPDVVESEIVEEESIGQQWVEVRLQKILCDILNKKYIKLTDNFFDLGGHSLKATRLVARIERELNVKIGLTQVFESPTLQELVEVVSRATRTKHERVQKAPYQEHYPASNAQKRLWILDKLDPTLVAYNMPTAYSLKGDVSITALETAIRRLIDRHEILRTFLISKDGEPRQVIEPVETTSVRPKVIDLTGEPYPELAARDFYEKEYRRHFDLGKPGLFRSFILLLSDDKIVLVLNIHHIISDGWSTDIMLKEIVTGYENLIRDPNWRAEPLEIQYKDYSVWQQSELTLAATRRDGEYWRTKLSGEIPVIDLPTDFRRPDIQEFQGEAERFILSESATLGLRQLSRRKGVSMYILVTALTKLLLYRHSGQTDLIIGTPVAGRSHSDLDNQIGFYVNTVVLRTQIEESFTFDTLLEYVRNEVLESFEHQLYPFDMLVDQLQLPRNMSRNPIFGIMLTYWNTETQVNKTLGGVHVEPFTSSSVSSKFDLTFHFIESEKYLGVNLEYATSLFESNRISNMAQHFRNLVEQVLKSTSQNVDAIPMLTQQEIEWEVSAFNKPDVSFPRSLLIHQAFEHQAAKTPNSNSVFFDDTFFSYEELNRRANQIASLLLTVHGVRVGDFVGLMQDRSADTVVTILAILKCGAAYVPIDPSFPGERISFIIRDTGLSTVVTEMKYMEVDSISAINRIPIDSTDIDAYSDENPGIVVTPESIAYIIYTSGSTGNPKGVMICHRNLVRLIINDEFPISVNERDRWVLFHSISFDVSVWEIFGALFTGGCLFIAEKDILVTSKAFVNFVSSKGITVLCQVPSVFYQFMHEVDLRPSLPDFALRYVIFAGEALSPGLLKGWKQKFPHVGLVNMYGITETTVHTTYKNIDDAAIEKGESDVGVAMATQAIYLVNSMLQVVPQGAVGEIAVSGEGVGKGYRNLPELTKERFVRDPFRPDKWVYLSGDLAKRSKSGQIIYLGRKDFQVKIRGFRIETSEVESALVRAGARHSVVMAFDDHAISGKFLAAYVTGVPETGIPMLREEVRRHLPEYMVPTVFVRMDSLPLNANGKVDRKKLPPPVVARNREIIGPANDVQRMLLAIWQAELGLKEIGITDNFFELGGHSLKGVRIISSIAQKMGVELMLRDIFIHPTVESLSLLIPATKREIESIGVAISKPNYVVSHAQKRIWVLSQFEEASVAYNMPYPLVIEGALDRAVFSKVLLTIVQRHESLRTTFGFINDELRQFINNEITTEVLSYIDLRYSDDSKKLADAIVSSDSKKKFDLETGPLFRFSLIRTAERSYVFLSNMHHIISDGWSMEIFGNEIFTLYNSFIRGYDNPLSPLELQYKDYSEWQYSQLEGEKLIEHRDYWHQKLSGPLPVLELPSYKQRPKHLSYGGKVFDKEFNQQLTEKLNAFGKQKGTTLFTVLLSVVNALFYRYTNQDDIILGVSSAGRLNKSLEKLIGFFVNPLVIRTRFTREMTFGELLDHIKDDTLSAMDHQVYPFDRLVDELVHDRATDRSPVFDVLVGFQNFESAISLEGGYVDMKDISVRAYSVENETSIFDLNILFSIRNGCLRCSINYNTDIYNEMQIDQLIGHLGNLAISAVSSPDVRLDQLAYLSSDELGLLESFNETHVSFDLSKTLCHRFEQSVVEHSQRLAVIDRDRSVSYAMLYRSSRQMAQLLYSLQSDPCIVGLLMDRSVYMSEAILGSWFAGHAYLPLDTEGPFNRIHDIALDSGMSILVVTRQYVHWANELQWLCPQLKTLVCIDSDDVHSELEPPRVSMDKEMWEAVGERAEDDIEGGGWIDSFTGRPFRREEMDEYAENTMQKLSPYLRSDMRVLEIGCASGITMFRVAPLVKSYVGTDMSETIIQKNKRFVEDCGIDNVKLFALSAEEIGSLGEDSFDLVIINSVVQNFNGLNYFRKILRLCVSKAASNAIIFIGDVMDLESRGRLVEELRQYKIAHPTERTVTEFPDNQFYPREFFEDVAAEQEFITKVECSQKIGSIENELSKYRFDVVFHVEKTAEVATREVKKVKQQCDRRDLAILAEEINFSKGNGLAYVIYTSGSTGKPKGAMIRHSGLLNHLYSKVETLCLDRESRVLQTASHTFDVSVWQFHAALLVGGATVIYRKEILLDASALWDSIARDRINVAQTVPSHLSFILEEAERRTLTVPDLRFFIVSGEALSSALARKWFTYFPHVPLINAYGPTEASDNVTQLVMTSSPEQERISLGSPLRNTSIYVLDHLGNRCPVGVKGEICIAGVCVGSGYLHDTIRSSESFVPNRYSSNVSDRTLYKTGDVGCWMPDGTLSFFGRKDHQVKVRGYRIELGEIENHLQGIVGLKAAVVVDSFDKNGDRFLIAYAALNKDVSLSESTIRDSLAKQLPDYMVPQYIVLLDELPVTASRKINRKALPLPVSNADSHETKRPITGTQIKLASIWESVLGESNIGLDTDFFQAGGHSLKATRVISGVLKEFGRKISFKEIYSASTLEAMASLIDLQEEKKEDDIRPVQTAAYYDLSHAQKRLWFLCQMDNASVAFNLDWAYRIEGVLDITALRNAFIGIVERHESLRTVFMDVGGEPKQVILHADSDMFFVPWVNMQDEGNRERSVAMLVDEEAANPFNLSTGPLVRAKVITEAPNVHWLLLTIHHIVADGWSVQIIMSELIQLYTAAISGKDPGLHPLKIQCKDYVYWQARRLVGETTNHLRTYWVNRLGGDLPILDLPSVKTRPAVQTYNGRQTEFIFDNEVLPILQKMADDNGSTLFNSIINLLKITFSKLTGQTDIVLGTSTSGRLNRSLEDQVGFYLNTLALRTSFSANDSLADLYSKVKDTILGAFDHQEYPFDQLVEDLNIERDLARSPIFDVLVLLQNIEIGRPIKPIAHHGAKITGHHASQQTTSQGDLLLNFSERAHRLHVSVLYNTDIFDESDIVRLYKCLSIVARQLSDYKRLRLSDISIITDEDRSLLESFSGPIVELPRATISTIIQEMSVGHGSLIAVTDSGRAVSYAEFEFNSNLIARNLRGRLLPSTSGVVLLVNRDARFAELVQAIWKLGQAYIPLDLSWPVERILTVIESANPSAVIVDDERFRNLHGNVIHSGELLDESGSPVLFKCQSSGSDLAYIIYTSGSTGVPKGAMVTHDGMLNHMMSKISVLGIGRGDRVLQNASLTFDISVWQFFAAMIVGGTTVVYPDEVILDPQRFLFSLDQDGISIAEVVPSYLNALVSEAEDSSISLSSLKKMLATGEALPVQLAQHWFALYPHISLVNAYGPTEASDDITHFVMTSPPAVERMPLGATVQNMRIYVINEFMQQVPIGVKGELCVAGVGVGKGYLGDKERTDAAFVENPFHRGMYSRMYKTGDIARWLPNGTLEFYGRKDYQVKIRGYRIEIGEIETALLTIEGVSSAVVQDFLDASRSKNLVGYVCLSDANLSIDEIRDQLRKKVPSYMVPAAIVVLPEMPLTSNGKIDRKKLPPAIVSEHHEAFVGPVTKLEKQLVSVWQEVLGLKSVSMLDDFFAIGGHSLKATQAISRIYKITGIRIELSVFFSRPTLKGLCEYLLESKPSVVSEITKVTPSLNYHPSSGQKRLWMLSQNKELSLTFHLPSIFKVQGNLDVDMIGRAWDRVVEHHDSLRTIFCVAEGSLWQRVLAPDHNKFRLKIVNAENFSGESLQEKIEQECLAPFDLENGPLARATLFGASENQYTMVFVFHHIITDGWSFSILIRDLMRSYSEMLSGKSGELEQNAVSYRDFAAWQLSLLAGESGRRQRKFWIDEFRTLPPRIQFANNGVTKFKGYGGKRIQYTLSDEIVSRLKLIGAQNGITGFVLQAAITSIFLHRVSGQKEIVLGIPVSGREHPDLENVVGFFVNTIAFKTEISPDDNFQSIVRKVAKKYAAVMSNQAYPFDQLVNDLGLSGSENPLFDVMLVPDNIDIAAEVGGTPKTDTLEVSPIQNESFNAQMNISFHYYEDQHSISGTIEYREAKFDETSIMVIKHKLLKLIHVLVHHVHEPISNIDLYGEGDLIRSTGDVDELEF